MNMRCVVFKGPPHITLTHLHPHLILSFIATSKLKPHHHHYHYHHHLMATKWFLIACIAAIWAVNMNFTASSASSHHAQAPSPSSVDCTSLVASNLIDCLTFVTNDSTTTKPQGTCCSGLKSILKTSPNCLCETFKNSAQFGISLNVTKALTLPHACKLSAPTSLANCALSLTPAAAPALSPTSPLSGNGLTPAGAPSLSPGNAASALIPFSAGSLIVCLLVALFGHALIPL